MSPQLPHHPWRTWLLLLAGFGAATLSPLGGADVSRLVASECAHCHGPDGNAVPPDFPKLAGLQADYLVKQLREFAGAGTAGDQATPTLRPSAVMTPIAAKLTETEIQELADYFSRQMPTPSVLYNRGLVELGRRIYFEGNRERGLPACAGCHRPDGSGTARSPMIAAQNANYVLGQLRAFRDDQRRNDRGRLMRTTAGRMTEQEMVSVAEFVAGLAPVRGAP